VLLSFLPPLIDAVSGATPAAPVTRAAAVDLAGWAGGTSLVPCGAGLEPARATRPNMLRGLAASDVLAVVPPEGVATGAAVRVLPLPW
jgi:molybdopterin molybdotransferase